MKPWLKWAAAGLIIAALAAGAARTLSARKASQLAFESQQAAQKTQVAIELQASDLIVVKAMDMPISLVISGPVKATQTAMVKARIPGELQGLTVREGDFVRAGQVLARIDPTESEARVRQARQQAQAAKAQVDIAQRAYDNNRALDVVHPRQPEKPGVRHHGDAGHRGAGPVFLPAPEGRPVPQHRLPGGGGDGGIPRRLA
jgi:multidrug efflux pump subunit AcrA (membrane-fusion protein)